MQPKSRRNLARNVYSVNAEVLVSVVHPPDQKTLGHETSHNPLHILRQHRQRPRRYDDEHPARSANLAASHVNNDRVEATHRRTDLFERRRDLMRQVGRLRAGRDRGAQTASDSSEPSAIRRAG